MPETDFRRISFIAGLALAAASAAPAWGQAPESFEVASVKPNLTGSQNTNINTDGGRLRITNASVKTLIRNAYGILSFQLTGEPGWLDSDKYDIEAKTETPEKIGPDQLKRLLQNLLADRFRFKAHGETRETSIYALVIDKNGPKLKEHTGDDSLTTQGMSTRKSSGKGLMTGTAMPMSALASNLGNQLGKIVQDRTGLNGLWDFSFGWDLEQTADSTGPSIFSALRETLGLRLESQKGPMEVLVIDNVEKATEN